LGFPIYVEVPAVTTQIAATGNPILSSLSDLCGLCGSAVKLRERD